MKTEKSKEDVIKTGEATIKSRVIDDKDLSVQAFKKEEFSSVKSSTSLEGRVKGLTSALGNAHGQ